MNKGKLLVILSAVACLVSLVAAFIPVVKGNSLNVVFLGAGVVFGVVAIVTSRGARSMSSISTTP